MRPISNKRIPFYNIEFDNISQQELFETLDYYYENRKSGYMVSLNVDMMVKAEKNKTFKEAFTSANLILMDSTPLMRMAKKSGVSIKEKLSGSDLMLPLCKYAESRNKSVFILGGDSGVPEKALGNILKEAPALNISGCLSPEYGFEKDDKRLEDVYKTIQAAKPDVLFICLGAPKSEELALRWREKLDCTFMFCLGAAVDFVSGNKKRAPKWIQAIGLEWLYRFFSEPKRLFRRYFIDGWQIFRIVLCNRSK